MRSRPAAAAKDKVDEVAPAGPADAVSGVKDALKNENFKLAPDNPTDAATAATQAAQDNPFAKFFGGTRPPRAPPGSARRCSSAGWAGAPEPILPYTYTYPSLPLTPERAAPAAAAKDKVEEAAPAGLPAAPLSEAKGALGGAADGAKQAASDARDAAQDAAPSNPIANFLSGALSVARAAAACAPVQPPACARGVWSTPVALVRAAPPGRDRSRSGPAQARRRTRRRASRTPRAAPRRAPPAPPTRRSRPRRPTRSAASSAVRPAGGRRSPASAPCASACAAFSSNILSPLL